MRERAVLTIPHRRRLRSERVYDGLNHGMQHEQPTDLAHGIAWSIADESRSRDLRQTARAKALQDYDLLTCAQRHLDLYEDVLSRAKTPSETTRAVSTP